MIELTSKGDFKNTFRFLDKIMAFSTFSILDSYGRQGVAALSKATPVDTGNTANSWSYEVVRKSSSVALTFKNSNIQNGVPIAIILQYGHGTGTGGWVEGRDYINPALRPIFDDLADRVWKEVAKA